MCVGDEKYRGRTRHVIGRTRSERLAQRRSSSEQTKRNAMTSFMKGRQRKRVYRQIHCRLEAGFRATVKPILLVVPRSDPRGVDKHAGAMVGSETIGSLDAGERKDDNEGTLFWRCVSFGVSTAVSAAMTPAPLGTTDSAVIKVAEGCGPGFWRGPGGRCHPFAVSRACPRGYHLGPEGRRCWPN
jgi:hypothetical protein